MAAIDSLDAEEMIRKKLASGTPGAAASAASSPRVSHAKSRGARDVIFGVACVPWVCASAHLGAMHEVDVSAGGGGGTEFEELRRRPPPGWRPEMAAQQQPPGGEPPPPPPEEEEEALVLPCPVRPPPACGEWPTRTFWQLRVPSSGSSTLANMLSSMAPDGGGAGEPPEVAAARRRPAGCARCAAASAACGCAAHFAPRAVNPGHRNFKGAPRGDPAVRYVTTLRHPALWLDSVRRRWRANSAHSLKARNGLDEAAVAALTEGPLQDYLEASWWQWNTFARSLAGNYSGDWIGGMFGGTGRGGDDTTRALAEALSDPSGGGGGAALLARASAALRAMPFFMILERYDESVAVMRHRTCLAPAYTTAGCKSGIAAVKAACKAEPGATTDACRPRVVAARTALPECDDALVSREPPRFTPARTRPEEKLPAAALAAARRRMGVDMALYDEATRIFEERLAAMRADQARGVVCRFEAPTVGADAACGMVCTGEEPNKRRAKPKFSPRVPGPAGTEYKM